MTTNETTEQGGATARTLHWTLTRCGGVCYITDSEGKQIIGCIDRVTIERLVSALNGPMEIREALERLVAADNCNYDRDAMRYEGLFAGARAALAGAGLCEAVNTHDVLVAQRDRLKTALELMIVRSASDQIHYMQRASIQAQAALEARRVRGLVRRVAPRGGGC